MNIRQNPVPKAKLPGQPPTTAAAAERFRLPERLETARGLRLAEDHPVVKQLAQSSCQLTQRRMT